MTHSQTTATAALAALTAAALGFAAGHMLAPEPEEIVKVVEIPAIPAPQASVDMDRMQQFADRILLLENENEKLQKDLDEALDSYAEAELARIDNADALAKYEDERKTRFESFEQRMERLKTEDPAEYERMVKQQEEHKKHMQTHADNRLREEMNRSAFFQGVDTSRMTAAERNTFEKFLVAYEQYRDMSYEMQRGNKIDYQVFGPVSSEVSNLSSQVRDIILRTTARNMGFDENESVRFSEMVVDVYDMTEVHRQPRRRFRR